VAQFSRTAIVVENFKEAALYFDHLIPVGYGSEFSRLMSRLHGKELKQVEVLAYDVMFDLFLPPALRRNRRFVKYLSDLNMSNLEATRLHYVGDPSAEESAAAKRKLTEHFVRTALPSFLDEFDLNSVAVVCPSSLVTEEATDKADLALTLSSLQLVDADRADWNQLTEFRRDAVARDKLRRLRLFAFDRYDDKPREYIEDDVLKKIADYNAEVRKWGFETKSGALSMLLNSQLVTGALTGSFISALLGAPMTALATAAGGVALETATIALYLSRRRFALRELMRENPVSYVSYAESQLQP
jgi:hypothetical protein